MLGLSPPPGSPYTPRGSVACWMQQIVEYRGHLGLQLGLNEEAFARSAKGSSKEGLGQESGRGPGSWG